MINKSPKFSLSRRQEMSKIKNEQANMLETWRLCRGRYKQLQRQMMNSAKGTGTAESKPDVPFAEFPFSEAFARQSQSPRQTDVNNIQLFLRQHLQSLRETGENTSNSVPRSEGKKFGVSMEDGQAGSHLFGIPKSRLKAQNSE